MPTPSWPFILIAGAVFVSGRAAPADQDNGEANGRITVDLLRAALGKDHLSDEVHALRERLKGFPTVQYQINAVSRRFDLDWHAQGVSLHFIDDNTLRAIHLYGAATDGFQPYRGELPEGLVFSDSPALVKKKLGKPGSAVPGFQAMKCEVDYPKRGVAIYFTTTEFNDPRAAIQYVVIGRKE